MAAGELKLKKENSSSQQVLEKPMIVRYLRKEAPHVEKEISDHFGADQTSFKRKLDYGTDTSSSTIYINKNCYLLIGVISSASNYGLRTLIRNQITSNKPVVPSSKAILELCKEG